MATRKMKWTSKAENGRTFRGKPKERQASSVTRPFKKPRQAVEDEAKQTDVTEVVSPEIVVEAEVVVVEIEDSEETKDDNTPIRRTRQKAKVSVVVEELVSSQDETESPDTGMVMTPKLGLLGIGTEVMRQFDERLFVGTVQSYDRKTDLYKILYSDGDGEHMDQKEYVSAYQLVMENGGNANDLSSRDSADEESAYQLPKEVRTYP